MNVAIIKYNAGNVQSVLYALQRLGVNSKVTDDASEIRNADKVIFPGVGHAFSAMEYLKNCGLDKVIVSLSQPVLGICLGLQLLCRESEEGNVKCLGIFDVKVKKFENSPMNLGEDPHKYKIPQIGWNNIYSLRSPLFIGIEENSYVYNVHGYYVELSNQTVATSDYIISYSAAMHRDNFYGVQFHAEKSAETGSRLISNFINLV